MFKKLSLAGAALAMGATALIPATPAAAQSYGRHHYDRGYDDRYGDPYQGGYRGGYDQRGYYNQRGYNGYNRYQYRDQCRKGDTGTIIGAIAGGLLGHSVAGRGDRTLGAVLGAGAGALAGRAIERSDRPDYCRR
ncbi:MAG: glycine zipper 2TM domain-containing protein [Pseudomonadota bacterium]